MPSNIDQRLPVIVVPETPAQEEEAARLAAKLRLPLEPAAEGQESGRVLLTVTAERLELRLTAPPAPGPVFVDFNAAGIDYRRRQAGIRREAIARAAGLKGSAAPEVFDLTAGLGRDAFILASLGCRVRMFERSPVIAALLEDGLRRARARPETARIVEERLRLAVADSKEMIALLQETGPAVICLDPMYPARGKNALPGKELRLLRAVVGDDPDADLLLEVALSTATSRVVVKRPRTAPALAGPRPSLVVTGRSSRFDVYLVG